MKRRLADGMFGRGQPFPLIQTSLFLSTSSTCSTAAPTYYHSWASRRVGGSCWRQVKRMSGSTRNSLRSELQGGLSRTLTADAMLDNAMLKDIAGKKW